ncbi:hypothetical protein ACFX2C_007290 [Malus domestica]
MALRSIPSSPASSSLESRTWPPIQFESPPPNDLRQRLRSQFYHLLSPRQTAVGAKLICFLKSFSFISAKDGDSLKIVKPLEGPILQKYCSLARESGIWLSRGGSKKKDRIINICVTPMLLLMMLETSEVLIERFTCLMWIFLVEGCTRKAALPNLLDEEERLLSSCVGLGQEWDPVSDEDENRFKRVDEEESG